MRIAIAIVTALLLTAPVYADEGRDSVAFMCMAAMGTAMESEDQELARDATLGHVFWLGRVDPTMTERRMAELAAQASDGLTGENVQSILDECGAEMNSVNEAFGRVVEVLRKQGRSR